MRDVLWACFWGALDRFGVSETCWGHAFGMLGGPLEVPWGPLGVSWEVLGRPWRPWERPGIVLGGPWGDFGGLGRSLDQSWGVRMLLFVGFRWYSEMSCFFVIFHRNLEVMLFSRKMKNYIVFTLILGGLNVAISLVLGMFSEFHVFSQVRFL